MEKKTVLLLSGLAACFCVAAAKALTQDSREANLQDMILQYGRIKPQYEGMVFSVTSKAFQNWYADSYGFSLGELVAALFYTSPEHKKLIDKDPTRTWALLNTMAVEWNGNYPDGDSSFLILNSSVVLCYSAFSSSCAGASAATSIGLKSVMPASSNWLYHMMIFLISLG